MELWKVGIVFEASDFRIALAPRGRCHSHQEAASMLRFYQRSEGTPVPSTNRD